MGTTRVQGTSRRRLLLGATGAAALALAGLPQAIRSALAQAAPPAGREVPARWLPLPDTISDALKPMVGAPLPASWDAVPPDAAAWRAAQKASGRGPHPVLGEIREKLRIDVEPDVIAGVPVFVSTPRDMPAANRERLLMHLHGGGYVLFPGEIGAGEGMMMAGYGRFRVVSVDYRMAPDFPFPAALDDALAVWKALLARHDPRRMAVFGTSAGGGLTLACMLRARAERLPLPAATGLGSPWVDLVMEDDSIHANAFVDNVLVSKAGWVGAAARLYAGGRKLDDPLISPLYGDFTGLPPAILTSGTRDLLLSATARTHRKLRQAGIDARLQVFEAQSHAQFLTPFMPETQEAFEEIARFFAAHLAA